MGELERKWCEERMKEDGVKTKKENGVERENE